MADSKISQLPPAGLLDGTEAIPAVKGGMTVQTNGNAIATLLASSFLPAGIVTPDELRFVAGATSPIQPQLDALKTITYWKEACRVSTTNDIDLHGLFPVDDVMLIQDDRVLVQFQGDPSQNGIYLAQPDSWTKAKDFNDPADHLAGAVVAILDGSRHKSQAFICTSDRDEINAGGPANFALFGGKEYTGVAGQITINTDADNNNLIGIDAEVYASFLPVTAPLSAVLANGNTTGSAGIVFSDQAMDKVTYLNGSKKLVTSSISSTELSYLSGVTGSVQTQLNGLGSSVDSLASAVAGMGDTAKYWKDSCLVSTTENIYLGGFQSIDGVFVASNKRVLVQFQAAEKENGIYISSGGTWTRAGDFDDTADHLATSVVAIEAGDLYKNKVFICSNTGTVSIGSTAITFAPFGGAAYFGTAGQIDVFDDNTISISSSYRPTLSSGLIGFGNGLNKLGWSSNLAFSGTELYVNGSVKVTSVANSGGYIMQADSAGKLVGGSNLSYNGTDFYVNGNVKAAGLANTSGYILQSDSDGKITGSTGLTFSSDGFYVNGNAVVTGLAGTGDRLVKADSDGRLSAASAITEQWVTDAEVIAQLEDDFYFTPDYSGGPIANTYQSQTYFNSTYFYICTSDGNWIRMQRV